MDQSATNLPHMKKVSKSTVNLWHLRTHFTGAIVHGRGSEGYLDFLQYPHDPNLTMNVLLRILLQNFKEMSTTGLPEKLYVQMDNCAREKLIRIRWCLGLWPSLWSKISLLKYVVLCA